MQTQTNAYNAGYKELNGLALWYPTEAKEEARIYWAWKGRAAKNAPICQGYFPLLIFSHGYGGIRFNQTYLAEAMARSGYIVAALDHNDTASLQILVDRPRSVSKALDAILSNLELKGHIDAEKIGMLGHSMGGYTSLVVAGAMPDYGKHPSLNNIPEDLRKIYLNLKDMDDAFHDKRIKAIAILAPGPMQLFDQASLAQVDISVLIIEAEGDEVIDGEVIKRLKENLPKSPEYFLLNGAGHYAFLPLSDSDYIRRIAPEICNDPGLPRAELHKIIQRVTLSFFDRNIKE